MVPRHYRIGSELVRLRALDRDEPPFARVSYSLSRDNGRAANLLLSVDERSGSVSLNDKIAGMRSIRSVHFITRLPVSPGLSFTSAFSLSRRR